MNKAIAFILGALAAALTLIVISTVYVFMNVEAEFMKILSAFISMSAGVGTYKYFVAKKA